MIARYVKTLLKSGNSRVLRQELFRLDPPLAGNEYVVVSAATAMFSGPETYIFGSDVSGENIDFTELDGSYRGGLDIDRALRSAGYKVERGGTE